MDEPIITVNRQLLTEGEAMAVRVALNSLISQMKEPNALGDDDHGKAMAEGYVRLADSVLCKMR
jgi:hypothetical protein